MAMLLKALACYASVTQSQLSCELAELVTRAVEKIYTLMRNVDQEWRSRVEPCKF